ncbi:MAG: tyrosine protein phosphatase, partial [Clostridia bacterium]|nr:tyrosine protein phosphatase [Clostridia bacterium]
GENKTGKKLTKKLLKLGLVDFVASDIHFARTNRLREARDIVEKKYGKDYAKDLFYNNAKKIIDKD